MADPTLAADLTAINARVKAAVNPKLASNFSTVATRVINVLAVLPPPPPPPPPPSTESANLTQFVFGSSVTDAAGVVWTITAGAMLAADTVPVPGTGLVTKGKYLNHVAAPGFAPGVYQFGAGRWWGPSTKSNGGPPVAGEPGAVIPPPPPPPPPPSGGPTPPPLAVTAGFVTPVLASGLNGGPWTVTTSHPQGTADWSTFFNGQPAANMLNASQFDVTGGILTLHTGVNSFAGGITTGQPRSGAVVSKPGAIVKNSGNGTLYQYGCFEICCKFDPKTVGSDSSGPNGQPAFWGIGDSTAGEDIGEIDVMECFKEAGRTFGAGLGCGIINWYGSNSGFAKLNPNQGFGPLFGSGGGNGLEGSPRDATVTSSGVDPNDFNIFGLVWTPTHISIYYNSETRRNNGIADTVIQSVSTTTPMSGSRDFTSDPSLGLPGQKPPLTFDGMNAPPPDGAMPLIIATGPGTPMQIKFVRGWQ